MPNVTVVRVPAESASVIIPELRSRGLLDPSSHISGEPGFRLVPILPGSEEAVRAMGLELDRAPGHSEASLPPLEKITEKLPGIDGLPDKWELAGRTATMKFDPSLSDLAGEIGRVYAEVLDVDAVYADLSGVSGELRIPDVRLIWGKKVPAVKTESGITYSWDPSCIMFASGNLVERSRMGKENCKGETVVDMFAGIGYFTLPVAKFSGARRVFACEKNPVSYGYLVRNATLNGVSDRVIPILGDNRFLCGTAFADRILMGYVQTTSVFLPKAVSMAKPGCIIHYHDTFHVGTADREVNRIFGEVCGNGKFEVVGSREVKSFAPNVSHYVYDVRV